MILSAKTRLIFRKDAVQVAVSVNKSFYFFNG